MTHPEFYRILCAIVLFLSLTACGHMTGNKADNGELSDSISEAPDPADATIDLPATVAKILSLKMPEEERTDSALRFIQANAGSLEAYRTSELLLAEKLIPHALANHLSDLLLARLYDEAGQMQVRQGASRHDDWVKNYESALVHVRKSGNRYWLGKILDHKALCEIQFGDAAKGYQLEEEAIKAYTGSGEDSDRRIARCYYGQAVVMLQADDLDGLKGVIERLKRFTHNVSDVYRDFALYNLYTLQNVYFSTLLENGRTDNRQALIDSIDRVSIASILLVETTDMQGTNVNPSWDYHNRAVRFVNYDDHPRVDSVEYYLNRMLQLKHEGKWTDIAEAEVSAASVRSSMWMKLGNYPSAKQALEEALAKIDTLQGVNNIIIDKIELQKELIELAKQNGDFRQATEYAERLTALEKERLSEERTKAVKEYEIKYKTQETQLSLAQSEERRANAMMWLLVAATAIILISSGFIIYALRQRRIRAQREMEFANLRAETGRQLTLQYIEGLEEERKRMARELHDGVCNDLLAIQMNIRKNPDESSTGRLIESCRESVRRISHELMPPEFAYATIDEVVRYYLSKQNESGFTVTYRSEHDGAGWESVPDSIALEVYRVIQEAVGNAIRHSGGDTVSVEMTLSEHHLTVRISDNGHFNATAKRGTGLKSMRQRANAINGKITISSPADTGLIITLEVGLK